MQSLKSFAWNVAVSLSGAFLALAVTAGFMSLGMPAFLAATIGTGAYVFCLLSLGE